MTRWGEINCPNCAEMDALWEGMERSLEESDAREARLEAKLVKAMHFIQRRAVVALSNEHAKDEMRMLDYDSLLFQRDCDIVEARTTLAELKGQDDG